MERALRTRLLPPPLFATLHDAGIVIEQEDGRLVSRVRVSGVRDTLFLHSAYPTIARDAMFLGPDSYRFADLILAKMVPLGPHGGNGSRHHPVAVEGLFDLIVTHPPFMIDPGARTYRNGGDLYGARLSLDWVAAGAAKLTPGGRLILHTGASIVDGRDVLRPKLEAALADTGCRLWYHELDPDIFGEELATPAYANVERIAAVGACVVRENR